VDGGWCLVEKLFHQPLATNHRPRIFNRGRLDARTIQTSRTAARIHSLTPSQRCRDGLSEIPEGTPEVYGVERLSVTNRFLTVAARLRIRRLHPRSLRKEVTPFRNCSLLDTCSRCYTRIAPWLTSSACVAHGVRRAQHFSASHHSRLSFAYGGITLCASAFQRSRLLKRFVTSCRISTA
jgi:hypothetical protein